MSRTPLLLIPLGSALLVLGCSESSLPTDPLGTVGRNPLDPSSTLASGLVLLVGAGDIAECGTDHDEATAVLLDRTVDFDPGAWVFTLGDNVYQKGTAQEYADCFDPTWGRHKSRMKPSLGNHDYESGSADASFDYFGDAALGGRDKGYYSFDAEEWHVVVLNDQIDIGAGSTEEQWLRADLAATSQPCIAAIWHQPRFYSNEAGETGLNGRRPLWQALYDRGADLILNGHRHLYERMRAQDPVGNVDPNGLVQLTVGTGGAGLFGEQMPSPNAVALDNDTFGVLKLYLGAGTYSWVFVPAAGGTFTDAGTVRCHGAASGNASPASVAGGPYAGDVDEAIQFDGSQSGHADGTVTLYVWDFGDGTMARGSTPSHTYSVPGTYTATLTVADDRGATGTGQTTVSVSSPEGISLTAQARSDGVVILHWSGADGSRVDVYRDGSYLHSTTNDGGTGDSPGADGTYAYRICEQSTSRCSKEVTVTLGTAPTNRAPVADAAGPYVGETGSRIDFDATGSSDPDGTIGSYAWDFGDGNGSTSPTPSHTYVAPGTYTVTLTVVDDDGATDSDQTTASVSSASSITLTADPRSDGWVILHWSGAVGSSVDLYRDGSYLHSTTNDGGTGDLPGGNGTYVYQICEQVAPACSNFVTVTVNGS